MVVGIVQLLHGPVHVQQGVPRKAYHIDSAACGIQSYQHIGIAAAVFIIQSTYQNGKEVIFTAICRSSILRRIRSESGVLLLGIIRSIPC